MTEEKPMNSVELAAALTEFRGRKTHPRLIKRAIAAGAPHSIDPLTRKAVFYLSDFMEWYRKQLSPRSRDVKAEAQKVAARAR